MIDSSYRFALWIEIDADVSSQFCLWVKKDLWQKILETECFENLGRIVPDDRVQQGFSTILVSFMLKDEKSAELFRQKYLQTIINFIYNSWKKQSDAGNITVVGLIGEMDVF